MRLRRIAAIVAVFAAVLIIAAYAAISSYDFNKLKPRITRAAWEATGRDLTLGDIGVKIGFTPALVAEDLRFKNAPWGSRPEMASIKRLELRVALLPLIFGNVEVRGIFLAEPDILIETDRFGRSNLELEKPGAAPSGETKTPSFGFKKILIKNGLLTYRDGRSGGLYRVKLASLSAKEALTGRGVKVRLNGSYNDMPFDASWRISNPSPLTYNISDMEASLGDSDLSGTLEASIAGKRPKLKAELVSKKLDLRPLSGTGKKGGKPKQRVFPDTHLPLDALKKADANVKFHVAKLLLSTIALNDLAFDMALKDGVLAIKPLKAQMGGGTLAGSIDLDSNGKTPKLSAAFAAEGIDLGKMLKELDVTKTFEGKIDIGINVKGSGGSMAELMAGLNGKTSIVMGSGEVSSRYMNLLGGDLRDGVIRLLNPAAEKTERTKINCVVCGFDINNGIADATALVFDTETMSVIGGGVINLKTEGLNISLKPFPKGGALGKRVSMSVSELAKPFKLGGTLSRPKLALDPAQTALTVGKALRGMALFGPAGIAMALVNVKPEGDKNPCLSAMEAAKSGKRAEKKGAADRATEGIKGVGEEIKKLFGR